MKKEIFFQLNGEPRRVDVAPHETLLDVLRGKMGVHSPKEGCGRGDCGACTVLLDGKAVRGCLVLAMEVEGQAVTTLEGLGRDGPRALQEAFVEGNVFQCGFCAPGVVLAASALLAAHPDPTERQIREALAGNLCRCTGYEPIVKTILAVAKKKKGRKAKPSSAPSRRTAS
ncbi:MAG: (2Fe-2S)-binding protein [Verrucomicrobiota bacterium]|jgi:carbon-monoxide dehydrogenase small subunit|nr:(2Fe-2S)-binding protein [Verrucomicrobiota bacterium]